MKYLSFLCLISILTITTHTAGKTCLNRTYNLPKGSYLHDLEKQCEHAQNPIACVKESAHYNKELDVLSLSKYTMHHSFNGIPSDTELDTIQLHVIQPQACYYASKGYDIVLLTRDNYGIEEKFLSLSMSIAQYMLSLRGTQLISLCSELAAYGDRISYENQVFCSNVQSLQKCKDTRKQKPKNSLILVNVCEKMDAIYENHHDESEPIETESIRLYDNHDKEEGNEQQILLESEPIEKESIALLLSVLEKCQKVPNQDFKEKMRILAAFKKQIRASYQPLQSQCSEESLRMKKVLIAFNKHFEKTKKLFLK